VGVGVGVLAAAGEVALAGVGAVVGVCVGAGGVEAEAVIKKYHTQYILIKRFL